MKAVLLFINLMMNGELNVECRQWENVFFTHIPDPCSCDSIYIKGTLFLTEHGSLIRIHWVPDPDQDPSLAEEFRTGFEIDVNNLNFLICRRVPGFPCRGIYLMLKDGTSFGPFEFRTGGTAAFIESLGGLADVRRSADDNSRYDVRPRDPSLLTSAYHLPLNYIQAKSRSGLGHGELGSNLAAKNISSHVSASLRRVGQAVSKIPMNSLLNNVLNPNYASDSEQASNTEAYLSQCLLDDIHSIEAGRLRTTEDSDFAVVERRPEPISLPAAPNVKRSSPLSLEQWERHLDSEGRVTCVEKLRGIIFEGGIAPELRPLVWKYLLGYYHWENTAEENERLRIMKHREYHVMKAFWKPMSADRQARFTLFRDRKCYIDKDVPRTDRKTSFYRDDSHGNLTRLSDILMTYTMYHMDFGYFQGMNDLLALILYVVQQEEDAFWCFVGLMNRLESNFDGSLNAVREQFTQLFILIEILDPVFSDYLESKGAKEMPFCFRWLLIHFKREFSYKDTMVLWEAIWSDHLTNNFHIFFAAAVLLMQRPIIMTRKYDANSILKHVNDLSYNIPLESALNNATAYILQLDQVLNSFNQNVRDIIEGPSLAMSKHMPKTKTNSSPEHSPSFDCSWTLFNDELEDLMTTEPAEDTNSHSSVMIPLSSVRLNPSSNDKYFSQSDRIPYATLVTENPNIEHTG